MRLDWNADVGVHRKKQCKEDMYVSPLTHDTYILRTVFQDLS